MTTDSSGCSGSSPVPRPIKQPTGRLENLLAVEHMTACGGAGSRVAGGDPAGMRGAEQREHRSTLEAVGERRYGAPEAGPEARGGSQERNDSSTSELNQDQGRSVMGGPAGGKGTGERGFGNRGFEDCAMLPQGSSNVGVRLKG